MDNEYKLHKGARTALRIAAVLCFITIVAAPFGLYILWRTAGAKAQLTGSGVRASVLATVSFDFSEVARLGICKVPIVARGIGGVIAKMKVGGDYAINLCVIQHNGKKKNMVVSQFDNYQDLIDKVAAATHKQPEQLGMGMLGIKWPDAA